MPNKNYNEKIESLKILYREAGENYRHFLDWRHKLIIRYFVFMAGLFFAFKWIIESGMFLDKLWILFLFGFIISVGIWCMDTRSKNLFRSCQRSGEQIEKELFPKKKIGIYGEINLTTKNAKIISTNVVNTVYFLTSIALLVLAVYSYIKFFIFL